MKFWNSNENLRPVHFHIDTNIDIENDPYEIESTHDNMVIRNSKKNFIQVQLDKKSNVYIENNPFEETKSPQDIMDLRNSKKYLIQVHIGGNLYHELKLIHTRKLNLLKMVRNLGKRRKI